VHWSKWSSDHREVSTHVGCFQDCLELHKLTVFTADAADRQQFYIQQAVHKPQRATVQQHIL
jgi:hypothetical protein